MLSDSKIVTFIPSANLEDAKHFYGETLGLKLKQADDYALEYAIYQARLRITKVGELSPADYTIFGWEVSDIKSTVKDLLAKGVKFEKYNGLPQDDMLICVFPSGSKVVWFKDPDGNILSITQFG